MNQLADLLNKYASGKRVLTLFVLTNIVYAIMLLLTIPKTMSHAGGMKLLDMMPAGYDLAYVTSLFNALGEEGRNMYLTNQIPVDMLYPLLFGLSYSLVMAFFLKKLKRLDTSYVYLCLLPVIAGLFDYLENIGFIILLSDYPDLGQSLVSTLSVFSMIKSISTSLFFIALIVVLIILGIRSLTKK